jgi:hypothetical protein
MDLVAFDVCWEVGLSGRVVIPNEVHEVVRPAGEEVGLETVDDEDGDVVVDERVTEVAVVLTNVDLGEDDGGDVAVKVVKVEVEVGEAVVEEAEVVRWHKMKGY